MKAVVMAGGEGSRLRPLTLGRPKPLVPLVNRPVMEHILLLLKHHGVTEAIVTIRYLAHVIQDYFGDGEALGLPLRYSIENVPLGTAGSVKLAEHLLDDTFLVISGDALTDLDLTSLLVYHRTQQSMATRAKARVANPLEYGAVVTDASGRIRQFLEKPSWSEVISDTINTGIYVLEPEVLQHCPAGQSFDFACDLFPSLLADGQPLYGYVAGGYWADIGTLDEYTRACFDVLQGRVQVTIDAPDARPDIWTGRGTDIAADARITGPVYIGQGVRIGPGAVIEGPAVIGDHSRVECQAYIAHSVLWPQCYVGDRAALRGAIIGARCVLKANAVLCDGVVVGDASTVDEDAVIQPDVKIWPEKQVEAGATVADSLVWGQRARRRLFQRHAVAGLANIDVTPGFAAKLGAAYGATLPPGSTVAVNCDLYRTSGMIKRAIIAGLPFAGVNVSDCSPLPLPVLRYYMRASDDVRGGVHVRLNPGDGRVVEIRLLDKDGQDIHKNAERAMEMLFFREDFRRARPDDIGAIVAAVDPVTLYRA